MLAKEVKSSPSVSLSEAEGRETAFPLMPGHLIFYFSPLPGSFSHPLCLQDDIFRTVMAMSSDKYPFALSRSKG